MEASELKGALEAVIFASGEPLNLKELNVIFDRLWTDCEDAEKTKLRELLPQALTELKDVWAQRASSSGIVLLEVAEGLTFRTNPVFGDALRAMREQKPVRLSRAALETLSIVAYRQPVTRPEIDSIRGVDCSATLHLLLDRSLVRIVGKREEPGLPMLYGTTKEFLSFFNLTSLAQLPSLREYHELTEESQSAVSDFDSQMGISDLSQAAKKIRLEEEPAAKDLDSALNALKDTEDSTRTALSGMGVDIVTDIEPTDKLRGP